MTAAAAVAVLGVGLLVLAVAAGWLGADVDRGAQFCELRPAADLVRQPANTWSNAGFVVAGLAIAWRARRPQLLGDVLRARPHLATLMACVVVLLGPASAAMHATESEVGGRLDVASMYLIASFAAAYALSRWFGWRTVDFASCFLLMVAGCEVVGSWPAHVPVLMFPGNVAFAALLLVAAGVEVAIWRRGRTRLRPRFGIAALGTMVSAFVIWLVAQEWCDPSSWLQGHALWHLMCALAAYFLFRLYADETYTEEPDPTARGA